MYVRTMYLSVRSDKTDVTEIGLKSLHCAGLAVLGIGVMAASFYCWGTTPADKDWLSNAASGAANAGAPNTDSEQPCRNSIKAGCSWF